MEKSLASLPKIKLAGIKIRTNNANEADQSTSKIGALVQKYYVDRVSESIPDRVNPDTTLHVYTDYESDHRGDYTFFMGEEVTSFDNVGDDLETHTIQSQKYVKFTTEPGPMPMVVISAWQKIWQIASQKKLGAKRSYTSDIEFYDERAADPQNTVVDIYIGIKK